MIRASIVLLVLFFGVKAVEFKHCPPVMPGVLPGERPIEISPDPVPPKKG